MLPCRRELRFHCFEGSHNSLFLVSFSDPSQNECFLHTWPPRSVTLGSQCTLRLRIGVQNGDPFGGNPSLWAPSCAYSCWLELDFHGLASESRPQMYLFANFLLHAWGPKTTAPKPHVESYAEHLSHECFMFKNLMDRLKHN